MERLRFKTYKSLPVQLKATFAFFICSLLQKGISVLTTPIFTRILTSDSYGRLSTFNSWYEILISIVSLSLVGGVYTTAMVKFDDDKKILSSAAQGLILLSCTIWLVIYLLFATFWNKLFKLTTIQMISMSCLILTTTSFGLWAIEQRVSYNYKQLVFITVIVSVLKPIVGIVLVKSSQDQVTARIVGILIVEIACYLWIIFYQIIRGKKVFSKKYWL
jgi:O-antigen/teichoic acid export membrane protein